VNYSANLLKILGIKLATVLMEKRKHSEEKLFQSIILQAFEDVLSPSVSKTETYFKIDAYNWFTKKPKDYMTICWLAGLDPDVVSERVNFLIKNKIISFTEKQKKWNLYRILYKAYRSVKTPGERRLIMIKINKLKN
jgi:hypothetical protein